MSTITPTASPAGEGLEGARSRLTRSGLELSDDVGHEGVDLALRALEEQSPQAPPRAQSLFVEQVVLAAAMREHYGEPELRPVEVNAFLGVARWFFNSFWHDDI